MTDLYIVSSYGDYFGVDAATLVSVPEEHALDADALEAYFDEDRDFCVKADANLIAAAPDLLAALEGALDALEDSGEYANTARLARTAIAKAKGA